MPIAVPPLSSYHYVPETKEDLDWADLPTIDLSTYNSSQEAKVKLAKELITAVKEKGFFYVKGFDISQERVDSQFAIGQKFYELPLEEKLKYVPNLDEGEYNGYRPAGRRIIGNGVKDRVEVYNIPKFTKDFVHSHPSPVQDHIEEIELFARDVHSKIEEPLLVLIAFALNLPEDYFTKLHSYEKKSEDHLRYMKYTPFSEEDNERIGGIWVKGHTDLGTLTLLFRQPVAALQIQDSKTGQWKWAKPQAGTLTVNASDALTLLTGGYIKSTIHRVHSPPKDQAHVDRLGLIIFTRPHNDVILNTITTSSVLNEAGFNKPNPLQENNPQGVTMEEFVVAKQKWQQTRGVDLEKNGKEILPGFKGQFYF